MHMSLTNSCKGHVFDTGASYPAGFTSSPSSFRRMIAIHSCFDAVGGKMIKSQVLEPRPPSPPFFLEEKCHRGSPQGGCYSNPTLSAIQGAVRALFCFHL